MLPHACLPQATLLATACMCPLHLPCTGVHDNMEQASAQQGTCAAPSGC